MESSSSVISCLCWIKRGVAKEMPEKIQLDEAEFEKLLANEEYDDEKLDEMLQKRTKFAEATPKKMVPEVQTQDDAMDNMEDMEDQLQESEDEDFEAEVVRVNKASGLSIEDEFNMEDYSDDEDDNDGNDLSKPKKSSSSKNNALSFQSFMGGCKPSEDPYITLPDLVDEEELEDIMIKPTDNLVVVGHTEEENSRIEINVYEEDERNHYVHHDLILSSVPLCLEWLGFNVDEPETQGNFMAVGQMLPIIDIWDMDLMNAVVPTATLGRLPPGHELSTHYGESTTSAEIDPKQTHTDAVLSLSANKINTHLLASASADNTVKVWDLNKGTCGLNFTHHKDKVQKVLWHPTESPVLLTGSYDRNICVFDSRTKVKKLKDTSVFALDADVESAVWNHFEPATFLASTESGNVFCYDIRAPGKPLYTIAAHNSSVTSVTLSCHIPGCLVTASDDKSIKIWDILNHKPKYIDTRAFNLGPLYAAEFSPDSPFILSIGGGLGELKVADISKLETVQYAFRSRFQDAKKKYKLDTTMRGA